ncbi:WYL domain-containing protein [Succinivibrio dextrinosolvens]|uniref:WYL domain-containing protein n=1 Tax=Succinivibrio dextrinosolvens TaxID=83771 RepID=UPI00247A2E0D|nr:WYL domain-containing protein [Succinivibrio dextrinosolvens]
MPQKKSSLSSGSKLLKLFRKLLTDPKKHFLSDLSNYLNCSSQSVIRMIGEIEQEFDNRLEQGFEHKRRWYRFKAINSNSLGLDVEEVRYLSICRDLADPFLPDEIKDRIDKKILAMSIELLGEKTSYKDGIGKILEPDYSFFTKGQIDYSSHQKILEQIEISIKQAEVISIDYYSVHSQIEKKIKFYPQKFICSNSAIYVIGLRLQEDMSSIDNKPISLAVHRIKAIKTLGNNYKTKYVSANIEDFGLPWENKISEFLIRFKAGRVTDYIKERKWTNNQTIKEYPNGDIELTFKTKSIPEVYAWCRSFGDQISFVKQDGILIDNLQSKHF